MNKDAKKTLKYLIDLSKRNQNDEIHKQLKKLKKQLKTVNK